MEFDADGISVDAALIAGGLGWVRARSKMYVSAASMPTTGSIGRLSPGRGIVFGSLLDRTDKSGNAPRSISARSRMR